MTLLYFEGFDMHARINIGLDGGGDQDSATWQTATYDRHRYQTGFNNYGQAIEVSEFMWSAKGKYPTTRVGFHGKTTVVGGGSGNDFIEIKEGPGGATSAFEVHLYADGHLGFLYNGVATGEVVPAGTADVGNWHYWDFQVNNQTGVMTLKQDDVVLMTHTVTSPVAWDRTPVIQFGSQMPGLTIQEYNPVIDNLWISDGDTPSGDVCGVQVTAAVDRFDGSSGFYGALIIGGTRYLSTPATSAVQSTTYAPGTNVCNVNEYTFYKHPVTNGAWSQTLLNQLDSWGLCCWPDTGNNLVRLAGLCLSYLVPNSSGHGWLVKFDQTTEMTYFSGPWTKSDTTKSYSAHVHSVPRSNHTNISDVTSLYIGEEGCLLFKSAIGTSQSQTDTQLESLGITFAEEFRTDYHDWVRVVGGSGINFDSMFVSGYGVYAQSDKRFQCNYLTVNYENVVNGAGYIQGLWDYATDPNTGRFTMKQRLYDNAVDGFKHRSRKLKIRGQGRALQLKVLSQEGKPFSVNGWSMLVTSNASV